MTTCDSVKGSESQGPASILNSLYSRFGNVVLLPVPKGEKGPKLPGWQTISFEQTQEPQYQAQLLDAIRRGGNIGVRLGNGTISVDVDLDKMAEWFAAHNPPTLATRAKRGAQFFFHPRGTYPNGQATYDLKDAQGNKCGEWRCGGGQKGAQSIVFGVHPEGFRYRILHDHPIAEIAFDDIRWPEGFVLPWQGGPGQSPPTQGVALQASGPKSSRQGDAVLVRETSTTSAEEEKPRILAPADNRLDSAFADEIGGILATAEFYHHQGECVIIDSGQDQIRPTLKTVEPDAFITLIERHCTPISRKQIENKHGKRTTIEVERSISPKVARVTLASEDFLSQLKPLRTFNSIRMPMDVGGKILLTRPGYDETTRTFTATDGPVFNEKLTADEAVLFLQDLLSEFCFLEDDRKRGMSVAVAEMLTLFCIDLLPSRSVRPIFLYTANAEGSGKSLLAKLGMIARLGYAPTGSAPPDEAEMRKLIATAAHESAPVLFLDNLKGHLSSPSLEALATSGVFAGRILGETKGFEKENRITVIITGNGCTFSPDLRRRVLAVELFLKEAKAEDRFIKNPLDDERILALRPMILSALWALVRAWDEAKRPEPKRKHPSFEAWSNVIAGILEHAGLDSPCTPTLMKTAGDRDTTDMETLITMLEPSQQYTFGELVEKAREGSLFARIIPEEGDLEVKQKVSLGRLLQRFDGRIFYHDLRFESVGDSRKNRRFRTAKLGGGTLGTLGTLK